MRHKLHTRLTSEQGFTLIELLVVIVILGILVAIAVPAYLSFRGSSQDAAAKANVRSAIPAAESWYQDAVNNVNTPGYQNINNANLALEAPGISPNTKAVELNSGAGYCVEDTEAPSHTFDYIGGDPGASVSAGYKKATIQIGDCQAATGVAGAS